MFLLKKKVVNTLVERVTISKDREINVEILWGFIKILDQAAGLENLGSAAHSRQGETYIRIHDI